MTQYYKPFASAIQRGALSEEKSKEILTKIFVDSCILDWKGVKDENDKEIEFSKEKCVELLLSLPDLKYTLEEECSKTSNYKDELGNY